MKGQDSGRLLYYLNMLNENWKRFDELERGQTSLQRGELRQALKAAGTKYEYAELMLAEMGWKWEQLHYDRETKTYSFPEVKPE